MGKRTKEDLRKVLGLPEDEPGVVNVLLYRGTVYGVFHRYEDADRVATERFGENARLVLDVTILRQRVQ